MNVLLDFLATAQTGEAALFGPHWWAELVVLVVAALIASSVEPFLRRRERARIKREHAQRMAQRRAMRESHHSRNKRKVDLPPIPGWGP